MTTMSPTKSPLGLGLSVWTVIVAALLVILAALALYFS
jgi:hypothetical protein